MGEFLANTLVVVERLLLWKRGQPTWEVKQALCGLLLRLLVVGWLVGWLLVDCWLLLKDCY